MRTRDLIAKRQRRERKKAREQRNAQVFASDKAVRETKEVQVLPDEFPEEVQEEVRAFASTTISAQELLRRRDMRDVLTFTIDPDDAKDFDDALSFAVLESGNYQIGIHIADVTHYVQEHTAIDDEAYHRGTSI